MSGRVVSAGALGFLCGVAVRSFVSVPWPLAVFVLMLGICALTFLYRDTSKRSAALLVALACVGVALGVVRMDGATLHAESVVANRLGSTVTLVGILVAEPDVREKSTRLILDVSSIDDEPLQKRDTKVLVVAAPYTDVSYGDEVQARGVLRLPEEFDSGEGRVFKYPLFLAKDGILFELSFANVESTGEWHGNRIVSAILNVKQLYVRGLHAALPEPEASLAGGITVGDKRSIGGRLSDVFQSVSLIHIVVLSGYNMTVVINAAAHVLSFLPRYGKFLASVGIVAIFILMTGGAASATRAGTMALLATYARLSGRTFLVLRVLLVVAAGMVVWNPFILAFDPGFQLSILATLGLVLFTPLIAAKIPFVTERFGAREIVASTLGTQIAVLPLLLFQNGLLSLVAIPVNLLALVVVPFAMLSSFIAALFGMVIGSYAVVAGLPAQIALGYIIHVAEFFAALPFSSLHVPAFRAWWMFVAYTLLFGGYALYIKRNTPRTES